MKVAVALAKNILAPLGITAAAQKKIHGSGTTTLIISNEEMNKQHNKIDQALKILIFCWKGSLKQLKMKQKNKKKYF